MASKLFKHDETDIFLDTDYIEFYIPEYYFAENCKYAVDYGNTIETFGVFGVGIFDKDKLTNIKISQIPMMIPLQSYDVESRDVNFETGIIPCRVLKYIKDQKIMPYRFVRKSTNTVKLIQMILNGYIPTFIPFEQVYVMLLSSCEQNNVNLGVPNYVLEMIISVLYRQKKDPTQKFSKIYGKDSSISPYDYQTSNIRRACQYASTFSAITFEDVDTMITSSLNRTADNKEETYSPMEDIIKY